MHRKYTAIFLCVPVRMCVMVPRVGLRPREREREMAEVVVVMVVSSNNCVRLKVC